MNPSKVLVLAVAALGWTGAAQADRLFTPAIEAQGGNSIECVASNIDDDARSVTIEMFNTEGGLVASQAFLLAPGQTRSISQLSTSGGVRCVFSSTPYLERDVQAAIRVVQPGMGAIAALAADEEEEE